MAKMTQEQKDARDKKQMEKMIAESHASQLKELRRGYINEPTVFYEVGERVTYGAHPFTEVLEVLDGGKIYKVKTSGTYSEYGQPVTIENTSFLMWVNLEKYRTKEENAKIEVFTQKDDLRLHFSQRECPRTSVKRALKKETEGNGKEFFPPSQPGGIAIGIQGSKIKSGTISQLKHV